MLRRLSLPLLLCLLAAGAPAAGAAAPAAAARAPDPDAAAAVAALTALDQRVEDALLHADAAALEPIYADDFVSVHSGAAVRDDKASWLKKIPYTKNYYRARNVSDRRIRLYGDVALVSEFLETVQNPDYFQGKPPTTPPVNRVHQLRVYTRRDGRWRLDYQVAGWALASGQDELTVMRYLYDQGLYRR